MPKSADIAADHRDSLIRLRRIRGQIDGVERMVKDGRYCVDILNQMRSIMAALRSTERQIIERHVRHCVKDALAARDARGSERKINELLELLEKR